MGAAYVMPGACCARRLFIALRSLLVSLLCVFYTLATAQAASTQYGVTADGPWHDSYEPACREAETRLPQEYKYKYTGFEEPTKCKYTGQWVGPVYTDYTLFTRTAACPANATMVNGTCQCDSGYASSGGVCVPVSTDKCEAAAGQVTTANYTLGWARGSEVDKDDYVGALKFPNTQSAACVDGCRASFAQGQEPTGYRSESPSSQGLYRISADYSMVQGGFACTPGPEDAPFDPKQPNMQCPGYVGEVNGKTVCVGNADKPIPPSEKPSVKDKTGKGEEKGNPKAGQKPGSGEGSGNGGSGRTPSTGTGGNDGGPRGGGGTGGGTGGEGEGDEDKKGCGLPGQPKCAIDETGTPDGKSAYGELNGKLDGLDAQRKTGTDKIMGTGDKDTGWGTSWSWFAHGQCRPINLGTLPIGTGVEMRIDICHIVPYTNLVLNFLWAVGTFIAILSMVFRVTTRGD